MHCRARHRSSGTLCDACAGLLDYSLSRIEGCRFREDKPVCSKCRVHCYAPSHRERIRGIMRYSGPRMLWRHPALALHHLLAARRTPSG